MANADLKTFIEDRLRVLDPTIDLTEGSPAQVQFVQPILNYLGTDPFETDIQSFILDRMAQEFPDVFAGDPGVVADTMVKPLILLMEPFKRETQKIKNSQSLRDASVLSDDDADALVANFFETRSNGGYSSGIVRVYYSNPQNVTVELTTRFFTSGGLNFYPASPTAISAEEMVFNREGSLYFMDVSVQAEEVGEEYNIAADTLTGVTGLFGVVRVNNPSRFRDGTARIDTPTFVANAKQALNERSMVTRRGATARLNELFQSSVKAIQAIGAGDAEMQRDILVATSPGHAWLTGVVTIYKNIAMVQCRTVDNPTTATAPAQGDQLYIYVDQYASSGAWAALPQNKRLMRFTVEELIAGPMQATSAPFQLMYFVRFSDPDNLLTTTTPPAPPIYPSATTQEFEGGFAKKGTVRVSSLPSVGAVDLEANNEEIHVLGHTDIYARPVLQDVSNVVIDSVVDDPGSKYFTVQRQTLQTTVTAPNENRVQDAGFDFSVAGVAAGDTLVIETGNDAGTYQILSVSGQYLYLGSNLSTAATALRYRIYKGIHINPFEPKIPKVPFGSNPSNDLQTSIGSTSFVFNGTSTDLVAFGVTVGDTIRVSNGVDAGDFTIEGITDGKHITVNRPAGGSSSDLSYTVFTPLNKVQAPLVRIKQLLVLDSAQQSTGVEIPYADPVAVVPSCDFTTAQVRGSSLRRTGVVLPQLNNGILDFVLNGNVAAASGDRRYSMGFDPINGGTYKAMRFQDPSLTQAEFLFPLDASTDGCSYFMATVESSSSEENFPPVDPKQGDALTIKTGPNKGSYLIRDVVKFKYKIQGSATAVSWVYFIKIYGTFPVDIIRQVMEFCEDAGNPVPKVDTTAGMTIDFPDFFVDTYEDLGQFLSDSLTAYGATSPGAAALQAAIDAAALVDYEWGDPARGILRTYFTAPTLFQQNTALNPVPTTYSYKTQSGEILKFRANPKLYSQSQIVPARLDSDLAIADFPRDFLYGSPSVSFTDTTRPTMFQLGVIPGDVLSVHAETFFHGSDGTTTASSDRQVAVSTTAGSNLVTAPQVASGSVFSSALTGSTLIIDEGDDAGVYTIADVPNANTLRLDRPLTITTPTILAQGNGAEYGWDGSIEKVVDTTAPFSGMLNKWITLYGIDSRYQGSYLISGVSLDFQTATLTRNFGVIGHFPAYPASAASTRWVITDAPLSSPDTNSASKGTELYGLRPIRVYSSVPTTLPVTVVPTALSASTLTVSGVAPHGVKQPFQIYRPNIRRVTPKEMSLRTDGPLVFFETEVVSMGPGDGYNLSEWTSYLTVDSGTYQSLGYRHIVDDSTLTYSPRETGVLEMSPVVLPVDSADSADNLLNLVGIPVQVSYEYGDVIQQIQDFISSTEDRVTSANMLARHFLPTYVSYDATYTGGSAPSIIAADIISYIDNLPIETPIDVSQMEELIANRGGNVDTPTKVIINLHDWDRKQWVEFSQNELGGSTTNVPYNGSARVSYFIPGKDASGQTTFTGERVLLTQR